MDKWIEIVLKKLVALIRNYFYFQNYGWLKDKILSEDGRKQQARLREVAVVADKLGCSLAQLAIGKWNKIVFFYNVCLIWMVCKMGGK